MITKERQVKTAEKAHVIGTTHNNQMANRNGLDEIDLWAMGVGNKEKDLNIMRPKKRHITEN